MSAQITQNNSINYQLDDFSVDRWFLEIHFNGIFMSLFFLIIIFIRFNKNILNTIMNIFLDILIIVLTFMLSNIISDNLFYLLAFDFEFRFYLMWDFIKSSISITILLFIISTFFVFIKTILLNNFFIISWKKNELKNIIKKEIIKIPLLIILLNFIFYLKEFMIYSL